MYDPAARQASYMADAGDLLQGLRFGGVGLWRWRVSGDELLWTDNLEAVRAAPPGTYDGTLESFRRDLHPDDVNAVWEAISAAVASGEPYRFVYRTAPKRDGSFRWIETRGGIVEEDGETWLTGACLDVTDRMEVQLELQRRLRQQRAVGEFGTFAFGERSLKAVADKAVRLAAEILDMPFAAALQLSQDGESLKLIAGLGWGEGVVGEFAMGVAQDSHADATLRESRVVLEDLAADQRFSTLDPLRAHGIVSGMSTIIASDGGRPFGVLGVYSDKRRCFNEVDAEFLASLATIVANSARQIAAVEHRTLLVREMAHRAGNMLQLVNTLAYRTFAPDRDIEEARRAFSNRLGSLSRANNLIARGGGAFTRFSVLVEETLEPFRERVRLSGDDVMLPPELCFDLGLVLHELSTNAVKYGSFAAEEGVVEIRWSLSADTEGKERFHLEWQDETCIPPERSDRGTGFGSKLMRLIIERKWGGTIEPSPGQGYRFACALPLAGAPKRLPEE
jgi:two-component sensor histidine kinase